MNEHCRGCIRYMKSCSGLSKELCEKHKLRIPRTNADRIRAMTDEELAEWIETIANCDSCQYSWSLGKCRGGDGTSHATCRLKWLDWLKQEVSTNG